MFPFIRPSAPSQRLYNCTTINNPEGAWCSTKVWPNRTQVAADQNWGVCSPSCTGQSLLSSSPHNLAAVAGVGASWQSDMFDINSWQDGHCHTFNPGPAQPADLRYRLALFLGQPGQFSTEVKWGQPR